MLICVQMAACDGAWEKEREKEVGKEKCKRWASQQVGASPLAERESCSSTARWAQNGPGNSQLYQPQVWAGVAASPVLPQ